jgi:hypothetical protein
VGAHSSPVTSSRLSPFGDQPTVVYTPEHGEARGKHFLGEVAYGYGLLITPTCEMAEQHGTSLTAHPYRVRAPVLPLDLVVKQTAAIEKGLGLLRDHNAITPREEARPRTPPTYFCSELFRLRRGHRVLIQGLVGIALA